MKLRIVHRRSIAHAMKETPGPHRIARQLAELIAPRYGVPDSSLFGRSRLREINDARQLVIYVMRRTSEFSTPAIARAFGRHHTTVLHALGMIRDRMSTTPGLAEIVDTYERASSAATGIRPRYTNVELLTLPDPPVPLRDRPVNTPGEVKRYARVPAGHAPNRKPSPAGSPQVAVPARPA